MREISDYIKREDAVRKIAVLMAAEAESDGCEDQPMDNYIEYALEDLADIPSADVAPVVRCKDCKYWDEHSQYGYDSDHGVYGNYCMLWTPEDDFYAVETPADGFCYNGERKDNE